MGANRTVYHVVPTVDKSKWLVVRENDENLHEQFDTKKDAENAAKQRARGEEPSQVKVHLENGNMEYESTYGEDPAETPN